MNLLTAVLLYCHLYGDKFIINAIGRDVDGNLMVVACRSFYYLISRYQVATGTAVISCDLAYYTVCTRMMQHHGS